MLDVFRKTVSGEGVRGLYKGLLPDMLKIAPAAGISWCVQHVTDSPMWLVPVWAQGGFLLPWINSGLAVISSCIWLTLLSARQVACMKRRHLQSGYASTRSCPVPTATSSQLVGSAGVDCSLKNVPTAGAQVCIRTHEAGFRHP